MCLCVCLSISLRLPVWSARSKPHINSKVHSVGAAVLLSVGLPCTALRCSTWRAQLGGVNVDVVIVGLCNVTCIVCEAGRFRLFLCLPFG